MQVPAHIRIGTRQSRLALAQAEIVKTQLLAAVPGITAELVPMMTTGDKNTDRSLAEIGGKGLFTKELEEALLRGTIDIAVHSLKDMETFLPKGLVIAAVLEREDARDALITHKAGNLAALPQNATLGTSSVRRAAQLLIHRSDFTIVPFRGNVTTRLAKLERGEVDATLLALAGLKRLGIEACVTEILDPDHFIPAVGQGTLAIECAETNEALRALLATIDHGPSHIASLCERSYLAQLNGSCDTPIAGHARIIGGILQFDGMIAKRDGTQHVRLSQSGTPSDAAALGKAVALEMLAQGGKDCL